MEDEAESTLYCGNLDNQVTEDILYELFVQVRNVSLVYISSLWSRLRACAGDNNKNVFASP